MFTMVPLMLLGDDGKADLAGLTAAGDVFDAAVYGLGAMTEEAAAELAWDFVEGKGERDLCARVAHQLRALGVPVRRESSKRVDLVVDGRFRLEFKVAYLASIFGSEHERTKWGLGVFDKDLSRQRGDLHKLLTGQVDLLVLCVPWLRDTAHVKYAKKPGVGPFEGAELENRFDALLGECEPWAAGHSIQICKRAQVELCGPEVGRVELTLVAFERPVS